MISGFATPEGTKEFAQNSGVNQDNFKEFEGPKNLPKIQA
jgi:hypothetical protein